MGEQSANKKASKANWLLWWKIDEQELTKQVTEYRTLGLFRSARGISVLCIALSVVITIAIASFGVPSFDAASVAEAAVLVVLAVFIYFGHRWAMVAAMALWTLEKLSMVALGVGAEPPNGAAIVPQLIWWCIYMHAFYLALRVEQRRRADALETRQVS